MIDEIFEMMMKEAETREGRDLSWKLLAVCNDLGLKIFDKFEELNEHFYDDLPDDPEELAWNSPKAYQEEVKRRHDRSNIRRHNEGGQGQEGKRSYL